MSTGLFRGAAGAMCTFDLPMAEVFQAQVLAGELEPIDAAAEKYAATLDSSAPGVQRMKPVDERLARPEGD